MRNLSLFLIVIFTFSLTSFSPTPAHASGDKNDPQSYALVWFADGAPEETVEIQHNGVYDVPFGTEEASYLSFDFATGIGAAEGDLYYLPGDGSREFVVNVSSFVDTPFAWEQEGSYELDVYEVPVIVSSRSWLDKVLGYVIPFAHAASPGSTYVATMQFEIHPDGPVTPEPTCTLIVEPATINEGDGATLTWTSENADTATIDNGIGAVATSGSIVVSTSADTTYTATFTGEGGEVSCGTTVAVTHAPPEPQTLGEKAAVLARELVNQPDGYLWGGKGWDYDLGEFTNTARILSGYTYYNPTAGSKQTGIGVDCSGLITWAFNRSYNAAAGFADNFVQYINADGMFRDQQSDPVAETELQPGDALFFDWDGDGYMDHVAMYVGESSGYDVVNAASRLIGVEEQVKDEYVIVPGFVDYRRLHQANIGASITVGSPVDLRIIDPRGNILDSNSVIESDEEYLHEIPDALYYYELEQGHDGNPADRIILPTLRAGIYRIEVEPSPSAAPSDTYSVTFSAGENTIELAVNELVSDIPSQGFAVEVSSDGETIEEIIVLASVEQLFETLGEQIRRSDVGSRLLIFRMETNRLLALKQYKKGHYKAALNILKNLDRIVSRRSGKGIGISDAAVLQTTLSDLNTAIKND